MIHYINVLHPGVVFRILGHSIGKLAVTIDDEFGNVISKFKQWLPQPHGLMPCKVSCHIFSIGGGGGHCGLSLAAPVLDIVYTTVVYMSYIYMFLLYLNIFY